jgi:hypothetical protein
VPSFTVSQFRGPHFSRRKRQRKLAKKRSEVFAFGNRDLDNTPQELQAPQLSGLPITCGLRKSKQLTVKKTPSTEGPKKTGGSKKLAKFAGFALVAARRGLRALPMSHLG